MCSEYYFMWYLVIFDGLIVIYALHVCGEVAPCGFVQVSRT
jgi:hypothetical protein